MALTVFHPFEFQAIGIKEKQCVIVVVIFRRGIDRYALQFHADRGVVV